MSEGEILHGAGILGKEVFFGVKDVFSDMGEAELRRAVSQIEDFLIEKGYAELDFNGNLSLADGIAKILELCSECEKFMDVQIMHTDKSRMKKMVYQKDGETVSFSETKNGEYLIEYGELQEIEKEILQNLQWMSADDKVSGKFVFTQSALERAKGKAGFGAEEELLKQSDNKSAVKIISDGLNGISNYYSFVMFDFMKEVVEIDSLMILNSADGSLEMISGEDDEEYAPVFKSIDCPAAEARIAEMFEKMKGEK